jgi:hypothetical protein
MSARDLIALTGVVVSVLGFGGTLFALWRAYRQYVQSEKWKRAEFVAKEIEKFESNPYVKNAKLMLDWCSRKINLYLIPNPTPEEEVLIDAWIVGRALETHDRALTPFNRAEAAIRDTFDVFLDHLDRFGKFIVSGLVTKEEFEPYLCYWIDLITGDEQSDSRIAKAIQAALFRYIKFYRYRGVQDLFLAFGHPLDTCESEDGAPKGRGSAAISQ